VSDLTAFGIEEQPALQAAAGLLLDYARHTQQTALPHIAGLSLEQDSAYVLLDAAARRTLEISETLRNEPAPTLLSELDRCLTALGGRLLRHLAAPPAARPPGSRSTPGRHRRADRRRVRRPQRACRS